jgi:hypothetical protein
VFDVLAVVRERPEIRVLDGVLDDADRRHVVELVDRAESAPSGDGVCADSAGTWFEIEAGDDEVVARVATRIERTVGIASRVGPSLRMRRYRAGQRHPPHHDHYRIDGFELVATAMVCLEAHGSGGTTDFPLARPGAAVVPRSNRLVTWRNVRADGARDSLSLHEGALVRAGVKTTATLFVYGGPEDARS